MIEVAGRRDSADGYDIRIAPVARCGQHTDAPTHRLHAVHQIAQRRNGMGVVTVVEEHLERMLVVHVETARRLEERGVEGAQSVPDVLEPHTHGKRHRCREHRILHVERGPTFERGRNEMRPQQRNVRAMIVDRDHLPVHAGFQRDGAATGADVLAHQIVRRVHRHVTHVLGLRVRRHPQRERIVGIQHRRVGRDLHHRALHFGQLFERLDALLPQVIGLNVEHGAHIDVTHGHAGAQQTAAGRFQDRHLHRRIAEHDTRGCGPGHVALDRALPIDIHTIGGRETHALAGEFVNVRQQTRCGGLAVGTGDRGNRYRTGSAVGKEHVDHLARNITRAPCTGRHVHAEARRRVHFTDRTADVLVRLGDVGGEEIHAADVEADGLDRAHRHLGVVGMYDVGHVRGGTARRQVGGESQIHILPGGRHRGRAVSELGEQLQRRRIEVELREYLFVTDAATRIAIHDGDQLLDAVHTVARDLAGLALADGHELAVDHQHAVIVSGDVALHDHAARNLLGALKTGHHLLGRGERNRHAASVVAVVRLGDHGISDRLGGTDRLLGGLHQPLLRHREPEIGENAIRLFLVAREFHRDVRRAPGDRGLDALLITAVAQLDEALVVQSDPRDVARLGGVHDTGRARPQRATLRIANEGITTDAKIETRVGDVRTELPGKQMMQEIERHVGGLVSDVGLLVFEDHVVHAGLRGFTRLAEAHLHTRDVLQFDCHVFENMSKPGAFVFLQSTHEAPGHTVRAAMFVQPRKRLEQRLDETVAQPLRRPRFQHAQIEHEPDDGEVGVVAWPHVGGALENLHHLLLGRDERIAQRGIERVVRGGCRRVGDSQPRMEIEGRPCREQMQRGAQQGHGFAGFGLGDGRERHVGWIDDGDGSGAHDVNRVIGRDERGGVFIDAESERKRIVCQRGEQTPQPIALTKVLIDDHSVGEPEAGAHRDHAGARRAALGAMRDHLFTEIRGAGAGSGNVHAGGMSRPQQTSNRSATKRGGELELVAAGDEHAGRGTEPIEPVAVVAVAASLEVERLGLRDAVPLEHVFIERAHIRFR